MPRRGHSRLDPFVPTGWDIVGKMIDFADVEESSVVVDLGSGDGRLAIESNRSYGARSIGVELNPILVDISNRKTRLLGLEGVSFLNADIRMISLEGVTHVTAYLTSEALKRIEHVLLTAPQEAIIVTHNYPIPGWRPVETLDTWSSSDARKHRLYKYIKGVSAPTQKSSNTTQPTLINLKKILNTLNACRA